MAGSLAGRTLFITGASRGIGLNIALRAASEGANIVIAAKTTDPHPKLPGTIYTAAKDVESAGGKCLPCVVDIRNEDQIATAIDAAVSKFGGIDVLINNASAIHLTSTEATPMKRYDLMHSINTRGTFLCSKLAIPHLKKSPNPHILNISPPLSMSAKWFKDHVAYTMAKYGMSMCVLGMAEELKEYGIAVNALWPQTAIYTAAMAMLGGGDEVKSQCRKPEIMADAAYAILIKDSKKFTGNFFIDETVLKEAGVTDLEKYACVPGATLLPDFFIDEFDPELLMKQMEEHGGASKFKPDRAKAGPAATFAQIQQALSEEVVGMVGGVFAFDLKDDGKWYLDLKNGAGSLGEGAPPTGSADCTMTLDTENFTKMFAGQLVPTQAFLSGKLKIKGDLPLAMKLEKLMKKMKHAAPAPPKDSAPAATAAGPEVTFEAIKKVLDEELVKKIGGVFSFDLKDGDKWYLDLKNGSGAAGQGPPPSGDADCTMTLDTENFTKMFAGQLNPTQAFMAGKLKIKGDLPLAMKLEKLMKTMHKSKL